MRRMMKAMNKAGADSPVRVNLEINPRSAVMKRLFETHTAARKKRSSSPSRSSTTR